MNFSFWPFLWFGLPGRLLILALRKEGKSFPRGSELKWQIPSTCRVASQKCLSIGIYSMNRPFDWLWLVIQEASQNQKSVHCFWVRTPNCQMVPISCAYPYIPLVSGQGFFRGGSFEPPPPLQEEFHTPISFLHPPPLKGYFQAGGGGAVNSCTTINPEPLWLKQCVCVFDLSLTTILALRSLIAHTLTASNGQLRVKDETLAAEREPPARPCSRPTWLSCGSETLAHAEE